MGVYETSEYGDLGNTLTKLECKKRKNSDKVVKSLFVSNFVPNCRPF